MSSFTCPDCGLVLPLEKARDLQLIAQHAKTCDAPPGREVQDLPAL